MPTRCLLALVCLSLASPALFAASAPLPLDVIGLYLSGATVQAGGNAYQVGDALALPGGAQLQVTATAAGGAVTEVRVTQPLLHACAPQGAVATDGSSGHGSGAQFSLSLLYPTGFGTHRLSSCYNGPALSVQPVAGGPPVALGFLAAGGLDTARLDRIEQPRVLLWNDQGGAAHDANQGDPARRPTLHPGRTHGNSRAVLFDAHAGAGEWGPAETWLALPPGVEVAANHFTLATVAAATSAFAPVGFITVGPVAGRNVGLEFAHYSPRPTACDGAGNNAYAAWVPPESPAVIVCSASTAGKVLDMLGTRTRSEGGNDTRVKGGSLGQSGFKRSGLVNMSAAIIVPWPLDETTQAQLGAALASTFALPQATPGLVVVVGDSHSDGSGAPFQQGWPQQMLGQLNRPGLQLVNAARYGGRLGAALEQWQQYALPNLAAYPGPHKVVVLQGGYNDQQYGLSAEQIIASFRRGTALAHAAGAKAVCVADVLRNAAPATNAAIVQVNQAIRAPLAGCDAVIDWAAEPAFNQPEGPYPPPLFASDQVHLSAAGQAVQARLAAAAIAPLLAP